MKQLSIALLLVLCLAGWITVIQIERTPAHVKIRQLENKLEVMHEQVAFMQEAIRARKVDDGDCATILARVGQRTAAYHMRLLTLGMQAGDPLFE